MLRITSFTLIALMFLGMGGCTPTVSGQTTIDFFESDSGKSIEISRGTIITIHLKGQLSTGYQWVIADLDSSILSQAGETQYVPSSDLKGAEEDVVWTFKSIETGSTLLRLYVDHKNTPIQTK